MLTMGTSNSKRIQKRGRTSSQDYSLGENLIREHKQRDFTDVYEIVERVGEGSISNIYKIRKKKEAIGGSSREHNCVQQQQKKNSSSSSFVDENGCCWFGTFFQNIFQRPVTNAITTGPTTPSADASSASSAVSLTDKNGMFSSKRRISKKKQRQHHDAIFFALKEIDLKVIKPGYLEELYNEIELLSTLDHPNIIKAYESFVMEKKFREPSIAIVMELCTGGDLYQRHPYTEREAANIIGKILSAVAFMHKKNIVHRDLKFENVMFEDETPSAEIKILDFGLSKKYMRPGHVMTERVGTVYTMAPQVLQGIYNSQADLWSVGVIAFMLLSGEKPFWGSTKKRIVNKVMRARYSFNGAAWKFISPEAKNFVRCLLRVNPKERLTAQQALEHKWLAKEFKLIDRRPNDDIMTSIKGNLVQYASNGEFKKLVLNVIARKSTTEEIFPLRQAFDQFDYTNDGSISYEEFKTTLTQKCESMSDEEIDVMFHSLDVNKTGDILYTEFLAATLEVRGNIEERRLAEAFDQIDCDDTGFISEENLRRIIGKHADTEYVEKLIADMDMNGDGKISYSEFLHGFYEGTNNKQKARIISNDSDGSEDDWDHIVPEELLTEEAPIPGGKHEFMKEPTKQVG